MDDATPVACLMRCDDKEDQNQFHEYPIPSPKNKP